MKLKLHSAANRARVGDERIKSHYERHQFRSRKHEKLIIKRKRKIKKFKIAFKACCGRSWLPRFNDGQRCLFLLFLDAFTSVTLIVRRRRKK